MSPHSKFTFEYTRHDFPEDFHWGAATSAHQIEGYNDKNDWWHWELEGRVEGGAKSGAATDHKNRFREDIQLAKDLGLNTYRFSIEWSRIEPSPGHINAEALGWYADLITACEENGLMPMATLHHFTSPKWFAETGGFSKAGAAQVFLKFVDVVIEHLGSRIPIWCTLNEPNVLVVGSYLAGFMPPASNSPHAASHATGELLRAHALSYDRLHAGIKNRNGPWAHLPLQVGIALNTLDFMPDRKWHPLENLLANRMSRFYNWAWVDAVLGRGQDFGMLHLVKNPPPVREIQNRKTADFIGINYYTKAYVQWRPRDKTHEQLPQVPVGLAFARRNEAASDMDWALHPQGFRKILKALKGCGLPIYITENGIADHKDTLRPRYVAEHLKVILDLIREGLPIKGYYYWSLLDNFEWAKGFGPRFGLYKVNYETFERTATGTAKWLKSFLNSIRKGGS